MNAVRDVPDNFVRMEDKSQASHD